MKRLFHPSSIRGKLTARLLVIFALLSLMHASSYYTGYQHQSDLALKAQQNDQREVARLIAASIDNLINDTARVQSANGIFLTKSRFDPASAGQYLSATCKAFPHFISHSLLFPDGKVAAGSAPGVIGLDFSSREDVRLTKSGKNPAVSHIYQVSDKRQCFAVSSAIYDHGLLKGIVRTEIDGKILKRLVRTKRNEDFVVMSPDRRWSALSQSDAFRSKPSKTVLEQASFARRALLRGRTESSTFELRNSERYIGCAIPIRSAGWVLVTASPLDKTLGPTKAILTREFLITLLLTATFLLVFWWQCGVSLLANLHRLSLGAAAVAVGDFGKRINIRTGDEFEDLATAFNGMAESLQIRDRQIYNKSAALQSLLDVAQVVMSSLDLKTVAAAISQAVNRRFGARSVAVYLYDDHSHALDLLLYSGYTSVVSGSPPEEWHKIAWTTHRIRALHSAPRQADDSSSDAGLVIGSPLIAGDRSVGVLVVRFAEEDFAEDDSQWQLFELLRAFGSYAAVALQNARSFARTEDYSRSLAAWLDELSALRYVTEAITASLDLREILQTLARLSCDVMKAHACAIMMMDNSGQLTISEAHNISSQVWDLCACRIGEPVSGIAAAEKRPIPCRDMPADYPDLKIARYARDHGLHGFLSVPLISGREAIGTIDVWMEEPCDFTAYQMDLLSSIAAHAAMAIQNARLFGKEYRIAETLQSVILGGIPENHAGLELGCKYAPALDEARVGGDFYDFVPLPGGKLGVVIADVSGKGLEAAMHTAMCKYMLRGFAYHMPDSPGRVLEMVNDALCGYSSFRFYVTMLYCVIDPAVGSLKCANAGHPPAILISDSGQRQVLLYQTGMPVGFETGKSYQEKTVRLSVEDMLILYTDGLIEARRGTETLGIEGLQEMLFSAAEEQDPQALVERIYSETLQYAKDGVRDDMAIVAVRVDEGFERVERVERVEVQGRDSNF